jgi:membrane associated rhomboid family serine protease
MIISKKLKSALLKKSISKDCFLLGIPKANSMIPLKDYIPTRNFPIISVLIIILNVAVFAMDRITGHYIPFAHESSRGLITNYQFIGGITMHYALVPSMVTKHFITALPTFFTSMFLHGNWLHIGSNMLYLWIFGNNVEDVLGRFRYLLFYLTCGLIAAVAQIISGPTSSIPIVGASGAIAGVMGAYLLLFPHSRILTLVPIFFFFAFFKLPAIVIIGYWVLIQFINASLLGGGSMLRGGGVAYFAHIGGFLAGIVWVLFSGAGNLVKGRRL